MLMRNEILFSSPSGCTKRIRQPNSIMFTHLEYLELGLSAFQIRLFH